MNVRKLILNGTPDDAGRLEWFCQRLSPAESAGGGRLRALAVELARRQELDVSAIAYGAVPRAGQHQPRQDRGPLPGVLAAVGGHRR